MKINKNLFNNKLLKRNKIKLKKIWKKDNQI